MKKYVCEPCGYVYDPTRSRVNGIAPGTAFEDIPEDWVCPGLRRRQRYVCRRGVKTPLLFFFILLFSHLPERLVNSGI